MPEINISEIEREIKRIRKNRKVNHFVVISVVVIVSLFALILIILLIGNKIEAPRLTGSAIRCSTEKCFIDAADNCESAFFEKKIETLSLRFRSSEKCELIKEVISVSDEEPESVRNLFEKTSMRCPYQMGMFSEKYINTISYDLITCEGSLVDAIKRIL
jgi:hypothetical protein